MNPKDPIIKKNKVKLYKQVEKDKINKKNFKLKSKKCLF